jgi:hypothetical protein
MHMQLQGHHGHRATLVMIGTGFTAMHIKWEMQQWRRGATGRRRPPRAAAAAVAPAPAAAGPRRKGAATAASPRGLAAGEGPTGPGLNEQ